MARMVRTCPELVAAAGKRKKEKQAARSDLCGRRQAVERSAMFE
jgi:hypothetical protein